MATRKTSAAKTPARKTTPTKPAPRQRSGASAPMPAKPAHAVKPVAKSITSITTAKPAKLAKLASPKKPPKLRLKPVRDSFTMPEADFALIATLKARAMAAERETKKSELLRAGLHALALLDTPTLVAALSRLQPVKIGRPKSGH